MTFAFILNSDVLSSYHLIVLAGKIFKTDQEEGVEGGDGTITVRDGVAEGVTVTVTIITVEIITVTITTITAVAVMGIIQDITHTPAVKERACSNRT